LLVVVAGVPGTGKTSVGSRLARLLGLGFTTLSWLVLEHGAWRGYDRERRSFVVDVERLCEVLPRRGVFETHWLGVLAECSVRPDAVVVTRCHPLVLLRRLQRRGWPLRKVAENVEAELVGVVASEALGFAEQGLAGLVLEVDTSSIGVEEAVRRIVEGLRRGGGSCCIDWLEVLGEDRLLSLLSSVGG